MNSGPAPWAQEIRGLGREIAAELAGEGSDPDAATGIGWVLWEGVTLTGEELMKEGYGGGFGWWNYKTTLALRTDGEIIAFETNEGRDSPNYGGARGLHRASDDSLLYPDAVRWEDHESIEEAVARTLVDRYRTPVDYAEPRGAGIKQALETVRSQRQPPHRLGRVLPTPPPQQKSSERVAQEERRRERQRLRRQRAQHLKLLVGVAAFSGGVLAGLNMAKLDDMEASGQTGKIVAIWVALMGGGAVMFSILQEFEPQDRRPIMRPLWFVVRTVLLVIPGYLVVTAGFLVGLALSAD